MKNKMILNITTNILLQVTTIISGFIIPKLLLSSFGSEVNGLVSSLTQFLNYIVLFEGGLSAVISANLYKPLVEKNESKISSIIVASIKFYRKLSFFFIVYTLIIAIFYPLIVKSNFSYFYVFLLTLILSINMFVQYCFSISYRLLLKSDKKIYLVSLTQILVIILNTTLTIILIRIFPNVHVVKFISALVYLLQPLMFHYFVKRYFTLDLNALPDSKALEQRWHGFGINLASFIHNNTDIVILSIFTSLTTVSIYSVYALIVQGLKNIITSISAAIVPSLGQTYAKGNINQTLIAYKKYELIINYVSFFLFTVGGIMITPFVYLYTNGINDANYNQPFFGYLMILAELIFCLREPSVNMAYSAGKFREVTKYSLIEAILNIIISLVLVNKYGLIGVSFGTMISMMYRTICHIYYIKKDILNRPIFYSLINYLMYSLSSIIAIYISNNYFIYEPGIFNWIIFGIKNSIVVFVCFLIPTFISYKLKK